MNCKKVTIKDAYKSDTGRGRIRIDPQIIAELNLKTGDVVEISHLTVEKKTAAFLYPGKLEDLGTNTIRLDPSLMRNIGASVDDEVEIRKIEAVLAEKLTFASIEESVIMRRSDQLARMLENRVITKGDILSFNTMGRRIDFIVIDHSPQVDSVKVHLDTKIRILDKSYEEILAIQRRKITYEDIGGLSDEIQKIREIVELPLKHPELFKRMGIDPPKSVLIHGLPGTGKTLLIRAVANESKAHFVIVRSPEIISKFQGKSEENLRSVFKEAKKKAPSIIYFDKFDSIVPNRAIFSTSETERRVIAQLLSLIEGLEARKDIIVLAETSNLKHIDNAFRRVGIFDRGIQLKRPNCQGRYEILKVHLRGVPLHENVDLKVIAEKTKGFVGAQLKALINEAAMLSMRELLAQIDNENPIPTELLHTLKIRMEHFLSVIDGIKPSASNKIKISQKEI